MERISYSRRSFLKRTGAASACAAFPFLRVAGQTSPNEKVNLACCGIGNQGGSDINALSGTGLCNIVALCDTEMGGKRTQKTLQKFPNAPRYTDFRKMLDKHDKEIDAVLVGTPDHSHFVITMEAMRRGKGVFVEKPLAHSFHQIDLLMAAEQKYKVATQMGNQGHSDANYFQFKTWQEAGILDNVTKFVAHMNGGRRWHKWKGDPAAIKKAIAKQPNTHNVDWDTWLAHVAEHDFTEQYLNGDWRCFYEFGNGALGDWGAHILDTGHEFLKWGLPTSVEPLKMEGWNPHVFPMASTLLFKVPARGPGLPACDVFWHDGVGNHPELPAGFHGVKTDSNAPASLGGSDQGKALPPGKEIYGDGVVFKGGSHGSTLSVVGGEKADAVKARLPQVPKSPSNHYKNFLLGVKGEETCRSRFAVSGPLCQFMCLGIIVQNVNAKLEFDPKTRRITNHAAAQALLRIGEPPRKGWEEYFKV
ncbi:MAG: Gfo/Idh/MocA family oxidoreductase [Lentisphaerae bacterium]|nr:Gfo/Idh/MocA family oxidoreductase [Lentisphaerota bacterium]